MMLPAQVKWTASLGTWAKISLVTALMTVMLTHLTQRGRGLNLYTVMIIQETPVRKKTRSILLPGNFPTAVQGIP